MHATRRTNLAGFGMFPEHHIGLGLCYTDLNEHIQFAAFEHLNVITTDVSRIPLASSYTIECLNLRVRVLRYVCQICSQNCQIRVESLGTHILQYCRPIGYVLLVLLCYYRLGDDAIAFSVTVGSFCRHICRPRYDGDPGHRNVFPMF
jgi:hypothetical protein